jgi:hypothetical protein
MGLANPAQRLVDCDNAGVDFALGCRNFAFGRELRPLCIEEREEVRYALSILNRRQFLCAA